MKDYKSLKLEYKLGGLGPSQDPSMLKEKVCFFALIRIKFEMLKIIQR